jgi:hypothetical protein
MAFQKGHKINLGKYHTKETKNKIRLGNIGKIRTDEFKKKISEFRKGRKLSEETKRKMRHKHKPMPIVAKEKLRIAHLGRKNTKEQNRKISKFKKGKPTWNKGLNKKNDKRVLSGENHPCWKGGISENPYPKEFTKELKLKIRIRDNFTCCLCERTEREELEELNRVLCVNHKDFDKNNCDENNLNTLCLRCNVKINREREYWTEYFKK